MEISVSAGIPDIASVDVCSIIIINDLSFALDLFQTTVTTTYSTSTTTGESTTVSQSDSIEAQVTVQPESQKSVTVVTNRYVADVPFTGTLVTEYADGTRTVQYDYEGVYRGAQISEVRVTIEADVPITV